MANSDLIKGSARVYASQTGDFGASFSKSLEKGAARLQQISNDKKREKEAINNKTANFINRLNSTIDVTNLDGAQQQAVTDFLIEGRNEYAGLAGRMAKMEPSSAGYMDSVSRMNDIQMSFQTLAGNVKMYKKDRVSFLEDFDNDMLSEGNEVGTLGEVSNIYTDGANFSVVQGGGMQFFDEASGLSKNYSDIKKPFLKDFAAADNIIQMNQSLYASGKELTGARRNMIQQKLKNLIGKGGRDTLMSLASDDFIMEGGLGLQDPMLFEPENQDALKQAVLDGYMNVLDASAKQGAADKAPKASKNSGLSMTAGLKQELTLQGTEAVERANSFLSANNTTEMVKVLNGGALKQEFFTAEDFAERLGDELKNKEEWLEENKGKMIYDSGSGGTIVNLDLSDPGAKYKFFIKEISGLSDNAKGYILQQYKPNTTESTVDTSKYN